MEGRHAGCWTVGVTASGNAVGLSLAQWMSLSPAEQALHLQQAERSLAAAGPDYVVASVADLPDVIDQIETRVQRGERPPAPGPRVPRA